MSRWCRGLFVWMGLFVACGSDGGSGAAPAEDAGALGDGPPASAYVEAPDTLDEWRLFADAAKQVPGPRTVPYDVISPLFSDYTVKRRFIYLPEGAQIGYDDRERWVFPEGAVLIKTFSYPNDMRDPAKGERLLETRLLVVTKDAVVPHTYVWNEEQTRAERKVAGKKIDVRWIHTDGAERTNDYAVPNTNQCHDCHGKPEATQLLGPRTRQLDRTFDYGDGPVNQLEHMHALGMFDKAPAPRDERERLVDPFGDAPLHERARSYLDANCAHCHTPGADAGASGMWLGWRDTAEDQEPAQWGVCKRPTSAAGATCGRGSDIVPGEPDQSIYMCRLESVEPKVQMPPVGRNMVHDEGVALVRAWIESLAETLPEGCH